MNKNSIIENISSDEQLRQFFNSLPLGIIFFQKDWKISFINKNFFRFPGVIQYSSDLILGKSILEIPLFERTDLNEKLNSLQFAEDFEFTFFKKPTAKGGSFSVIVKGVSFFVSTEFQGGILIVEDIKIDKPDSTELINANDYLISVIDSLSDYYMICDLDLNIKFKSNSSNFLFDYFIEKPQEQIKTVNEKITNSELKQLILSTAKSKSPSKQQFSFPMNFRDYFIDLNIIPVFDSLSHTELVFIVGKDVSEEVKSSNQTIKEVSELRKYHEIVTTIVDAVIGLNNSGNVIYWNEKATKLFDYNKSQVFNQFIGKVIPQLGKLFFESIVEEVALTGKWEGQLKQNNDPNDERRILVRLAPIASDNEKMLVALCTDITERYRLERELRNSEEKFRNIVINSHEFICILDLNGEIVYSNPFFNERFTPDQKPDKIKNFTDYIEPFYIEKNKIKFGDLFNGRDQNIELPLITFDKKKIIVLASFTPSYNLAGEPIYFNAILTDITLQKEAEKDLLLIRSVFEASKDGIALVSDGKLVIINDSFVSMFGLESAGTSLGKDIIEFVASNDRSSMRNYLNSINKGIEIPPRFEFNAIRTDSTNFIAEVSISIYDVSKEIFSVWIIRDITEEKKAQDALKRSEERYRNLANNIDESFWVAERIDNKLKTVLYTSAIKKITGYSPDEFITDNNLWFNIIHPNDLEEIRNKQNLFFDDISIDNQVFEYRILDKFGGTVWIRNKISVVRNSKGNVFNAFGIINDISLSKKADDELKTFTENLKELNETKDRFISIISHDLRTPFSSILGFTDILLNEENIDVEKRREYINFIQESSKSMLSLVNSLLDYTRIQTGRIKFEPERISSKDLFEKSLKVLGGAALQKNITLELNFPKELFIHADESLFSQAVNNLISNAIKFTRKEGTISISAAPSSDKNKIEFRIKDNGVGIKKDDIAKLFKVDAKFTTPGTSGEKGTGLGLSLVHDIIKKHGGEIRVESVIGKGSEFIFTLPVSSTIILLVDDTKADRLLYTKILKNIIPDYTIIEAENGREAFNLIKSNSPALVITDHQMPIMTGMDLVKQVSISEFKIKPPIIVLSSDVTPKIEKGYKDLGIEFIFTKPVNLSVFKSSIEKSLRKVIYNT
ncbi:MAG: PAS domain S-box protein [Melioribacteraceae bacterium]